MSEFIDLVICKHEGNNCNYLFAAPPFSNLQEADRVLVETKRGQKEAIVQDCATIENKSKEYEFLLKCASAYEPLKRVVGKIVYRMFDYAEESHE